MYVKGRGEKKKPEKCSSTIKCLNKLNNLLEFFILIFLFRNEFVGTTVVP